MKQVLSFVFLSLVIGGATAHAEDTLIADNPTTAVKTTKPKSKKHPTYLNFVFGSVEYMWWQEPLELVAPSGTRYAMVTSANGPCAGVGWKHLTATSEWNIQGCFFSAANDVGLVNHDLVVKYFQPGIQSYGAMIGPSWLYRPSSGSVSVGLELPVFYRYADWTTPPDPGYSVTNRTLITGGALFEAGWTSKKVTFLQKVGFMYKMAALWSLGVDFHY